MVKLLSLLDLYIVQVDGIVATIILYYFFGVLAGRIGSLVVGGILKACRVIRYTPREEYIKASQKDAEIKKLLEVNNMYRTFVGVGAFIDAQKEGRRVVHQHIHPTIFLGDCPGKVLQCSLVGEIAHIVVTFCLVNDANMGAVLLKFRFYNKCWGQVVSLTPKLYL